MALTLWLAFAPTQAMAQAADNAVKNIPEPAAAEAVLGPPEIQTPDACAAAISRISSASAQSRSLRQLYKKNLHFRGDRHNFIPHWNADYSDIEKVFVSLAPADIPRVVHLMLDRNHNKSGMQSIGAGVLKMFGPKAQPCIEAGLRQPGASVHSALQGINTSIQTDMEHPLR